MALLGYLAIGHLGTTFHGLKHPRKDLMARLGRKSARKMYIDRADGSGAHVGYIVAGEWFTVYEVHEWTGTS